MQYPSQALLQNPIQNPIAPGGQQLSPETWKAILAANAAGDTQSDAALKAEALRRHNPAYAQGRGPYGIRTGEGPGGFMVSIGDAIGAIAGKASDKEAADALGISTAEYRRLLAIAQTGVMNDTYNKPQPVPQGSPLTVGSGGGDDSGSPLGL